ncbi:protein-glucosylgalactosylhydroxylysine glucosidase [Patella vulgata]|uniref:protein-glucosylgalactosylhydroxylysine glucosidase n=1 Tax=Patella vulgata TaxID=6465 RepID=UPI0024A7BD78|nr:protein-glucosylgalactosylhydroxylysine glucosidase [Patella vulgata]
MIIKIALWSRLMIAILMAGIYTYANNNSGDRLIPFKYGGGEKPRSRVEESGQGSGDRLISFKHGGGEKPRTRAEEFGQGSGDRLIPLRYGGSEKSRTRTEESGQGSGDRLIPLKYGGSEKSTAMVVEGADLDRNKLSESPEDVKITRNKETQNVKQKCYRSHGPTRIEVPCKNKFSFQYDDIPGDPAIIETDKLPSDPRLLPEIGNGHIATVIHSDTICMNGLYNGANTSSHRARIPSIVSLIVDSIKTSNGSYTKKYLLDMKNGIFRERFFGEDYRIEIRTYAHRILTRVMAVEVDIEKDGLTDLTINFHTNTGKTSDDIHFGPVVDKDYTYTTTGETLIAEYPDIKPTTPVALVYDHILNNITVPAFIKSETVYFFAAFGVNKTEATYYHQRASDLFVNDTFRHEHINAWNDLWNKGRIDVLANNNKIGQIIYASLYYLLSSLPVHPDEANWPFMGLAPGGLAHGYYKSQDYSGHVFWDQDTWMFPPIMMLHADVGKLIVQSRLRKLDAARRLAKMRGFPGAMYPWESAYTGLPTSTSETCSTNEIHISADVAFALRQYWLLTTDDDFLVKDRGAEALIDLATFWAARVTLNQQTKKYEILDVMGPDEYHYHKNNSVYINTIARITLMTGQMAAVKTGRTPPTLWQSIIDNMYIPIDNHQYFYHPEYDGYPRGEIVKQGDVILIGFPLMSQSPNKTIQQNDLIYYANVTPSGPAMTWGMFAINWLEQGNLTLAEKYYNKQFGNIQPPFQTWTENADGSGAVNFHTGIGGYLQSIIFGYGGFRIRNDMLIFDPQIIPNVNQWNITGLDYKGGSFHFQFAEFEMYITQTVVQSPMSVYLFASGTSQPLVLNETAFIPRQRAALIMRPNSQNSTFNIKL